MMHEQVNLTIPEGQYYLADAGFGVCDALLVPYRGVRYHLAEWGRLLFGKHDIIFLDSKLKF